METTPEQLKQLHDSCLQMQKQIEENQAQLASLTRQLEELLSQEQAEANVTHVEEPVHVVPENTPEAVITPSYEKSDVDTAEINTSPEGEKDMVDEPDNANVAECYDSTEELAVSVVQVKELEKTHVEEPDKKEQKIEEPRPDFHTRYMEQRKDFSFEMSVGKKLLPIAASALILFAIIMFGKLIQPALSDGMRACILALISLAISVVGIMKMKPESKYYNWYAALAGCGVAACYVTSLVSHFVLEVMSQTGLMICLAVWIVVVMGLSRFKSKMFQYICYLGILIAAGMSIFQWNDSPLGIGIYVASIVALFVLNFSKNFKEICWYFIQFPIVMAMMALAYDEPVTVDFIFVAVLVVMVGHVIYHSKRTQNQTLFLFSVLPALPALAFSRPFNAHLGDYYHRLFLIGNASNNPDLIVFAIVVIAVAVLLYRTFCHKDIYNPVFMAWLTLLVIILPLLDYNDQYNYWAGAYFVPAIVMFGLGHIIHNGLFRKIGIGYLLLFAFNMPEAGIVQFASGTVLQCSIWIFLVMMTAFLYLSRINRSRTEVMALLVMYGVFLALLFKHLWIDTTLLYALSAGYLLILNTSRIRNSKLLNANGVFDNVVLTFTFILSFIYFFNRFHYFNGLATIYEHISVENLEDTVNSIPLLYINDHYSGLIFVLASSLLLLLAGSMRKYKGMIHASYANLPISAMILTGTSPIAIAIVVYLGVLALMTFMSRKYYLAYDKICLTLVFAMLPIYLLRRDVINIEECWMALSVITLACILTPAVREKSSEDNDVINTYAIIANDVLLFIGMLLIRTRHYELYWTDYIEGTKEIMSVLIFVLLFTMAITSIQKQLRHRNENNEKYLSVYNGIKFTLLFVSLMFRYSVVSYVVTIVLLLLAIVFIIAGFRFSLRGLRLYGLCMSMFSVIKLLFFDIEFDNAFYRPLSFLISGLLLFGISFIYFRIEKMNGRQGS